MSFGMFDVSWSWMFHPCPALSNSVVYGTLGSIKSASSACRSADYGTLIESAYTCCCRLGGVHLTGDDATKVSFQGRQWRAYSVVGGPRCRRAHRLFRTNLWEETMRSIVVLAFMSLVVAAGAADSLAQTAGSSLVSVSVAELREVATGWSAKKQILGKDVYNDAGDKIGDINDLIVTPSRSLSYAIVGVGGFLGIGEHNVAVPVSMFKQQTGRITLPGATKDALKATPKFEYAK